MDDHSILITFVFSAALAVFFLLLSVRIGIPAIVLFLLGGILSGPYVIGIIQPLHLGAGLNTIVSLAVAVILFEGGLTLDIRGYRQASREIIGFLTRGVLVTWFVSALFIQLIFNFGWAFSLTAASLIIVTGPTVIGPLLQRIGIKSKMHNILYWEGVLIDPIGVFIALLCFEWMLSFDNQQAISNFLLRFISGIGLGVLFGYVLHYILKKEIIFRDNQNIFVLSVAMLNFAIANSLISESGLLSVTISGLVLGYKGSPRINKLIEFKAELKDFLIGLLFILLSANLKLEKFIEYGPKLLVVVALVVVVVRPLNVFFATLNSQTTWKEKLFLSWIAPRGIIAASMASLFAYNFEAKGNANAAFLEAFTYSVITVTIIFQGFSAKFVGKVLGLLEKEKRGWLFIGANALSRTIGLWLKKNGFPVVILDRNLVTIKIARKEGLTSLYENGFVLKPDRFPELMDVGHVIAMTENEALNELLCQHWHNINRKLNLFYWHTGKGNVSESRMRIKSAKPMWSDIDIKSFKTDLHSDIEELSIHSLAELDKVSKHQLAGSQNLMAITSDSDHKKKVITAVSFDNINEELSSGKSVHVLAIKTDNGSEGKPVVADIIMLTREKDLFVLYKKMLGSVAEEFPFLDQQQLSQEIIEREKEFSSFVGHKISIPHCYSQHINHPILIIAKNDSQIKCPVSGVWILVVCMLISPLGKPKEHLNMLANLARVLEDSQSREMLFNAQSIERIAKLLGKDNHLKKQQS